MIEEGVDKVGVVVGPVHPVEGLGILPELSIVGTVPDSNVDPRVRVLREFVVPQSKDDGHVRLWRVGPSVLGENEVDFHDGAEPGE